MKLTRAAVLAGVLAAGTALAACSSSSPSGGDTSSSDSSSSTSSSSSSAAAAPTCSSGTLDGAGSTAQANAMTSWINTYTGTCSGAKVNYNPVGSGSGITDFSSKQVDFAGSDAALDPSAGEVKMADKACPGGDALDLPMVVGPIAVPFNLGTSVTSLTLTPTLIAQIFTGKITMWNDSAITAENKGVTLPAAKINVVYRSDSSGTTENFEKFLAANAPSVFKATPAKDNASQVFAGQGKTGSSGVAAGVKSTSDSIAYDEYSYAVNGSLNTVGVDTGSGAVPVNKTTAAAAAAAAKVVSNGNSGDLSLQLNYATKASGAYPLILVTYEIVCSKYANAATGTFVKNFLTYTAGGGQSVLAGLGYAPLPTSLDTQVLAQLAKIS